MDSGDYRTLAAFGEWAVRCYPAEYYIVLVGGHGGGWSQSEDDRQRNRQRNVGRRGRRSRMRAGRELDGVRLIAPDDEADSEMSIDQLAEALTTIRRATRRPSDPRSMNRLLAYGSDACLMQTFEVAYELRNVATYLLGSEETEPGPGWPYNTIIRELTTRPGEYFREPRKLIQMMVRNYGLSYSPQGGERHTEKITMAAVATSEIPEARNRLTDIARLLLELVDEEQRAGGEQPLTDRILDARNAAFNFGDGYADLGAFVTELRRLLLEGGLVPRPGQHWPDDKESWRTLRERMDELMGLELWGNLVVAKHMGEAFDKAMGVSVYFPRDSCGGGLSMEEYRKSPFSQDVLYSRSNGWAELVEKVTAGHRQLYDDYANFGVGDTRLMLEGAQLPVSPNGEPFAGFVECEIHDDTLSVYPEDADCVYVDHDGDAETADECVYVDVSFEAQVPSRPGGRVAVKDVHIWSDQLGLDWSLADEPIVDLSLQGILGDESIEGAFAVTFNREGDAGSPVTARVRFLCESFSTYRCNDDWSYRRQRSRARFEAERP